MPWSVDHHIEVAWQPSKGDEGLAAVFRRASELHAPPAEFIDRGIDVSHMNESW